MITKSEYSISSSIALWHHCLDRSSLNIPHLCLCFSKPIYFAKGVALLAACFFYLLSREFAHSKAKEVNRADSKYIQKKMVTLKSHFSHTKGLVGLVDTLWNNIQYAKRQPWMVKKHFMIFDIFWYFLFYEYKFDLLCLKLLKLVIPKGIFIKINKPLKLYYFFFAKMLIFTHGIN